MLLDSENDYHQLLSIDNFAIQLNGKWKVESENGFISFRKIAYCESMETSSISRLFSALQEKRLSDNVLQYYIGAD